MIWRQIFYLYRIERDKQFNVKKGESIVLAFVPTKQYPRSYMGETGESRGMPI